MEDFIKYLTENFGESAEKLAKTSQDNPLFDFDLEMINLDEMAKQLPKLNRIYNNNQFATADALFISKEDDEFTFHFVEFKNVDYEKEKDLKMSKYWLEKCLSEMNECEHECFINDETSDIYKSKFPKYLVDKYNVSLRAKPYESISLIDIYLKMFKSIDDDFSRNYLFNVKKNFYIVSKTNKFLNHPHKNMSNTHMAKMIGPFKAMTRLYPYHYSMARAISDDVFKEYIRGFVN